jgi:hypothetical protein
MDDEEDLELPTDLDEEVETGEETTEELPATR